MALRRMALAATVALGLLAGACAQSAGGSASVRVLTHRDFHLPTDALEAFTASTGIEVLIFREDTPDDVVGLLERSRDHPVADVVVGIDTLDLVRVAGAGLTSPYVPVEPGPLTPELAADDHLLTPISYLDACLNYLPSFYVAPERAIDELPEAAELPPPVPQGLDALLDAAHRNTAVVPDAGTSRMGAYLLVALERRYPQTEASPAGDDAGSVGAAGDSDTSVPWPQVLDRMLSWGVELTTTWELAVFGRFAGGEPPPERPISQDQPEPVTLGSLRGRLPLTWGSAGLPAVFARYQPGVPEVLDIAVAPNDCVRIGFYAGVVAGAQNASLGGRLIDHMVQPLFQYRVADRFGSRPARSDIVSTPEWQAFGTDVLPYRPDPAYVGANWRQWQATWNQVVRNFGTAPPPPEPDVTVTLPDS